MKEPIHHKTTVSRQQMITTLRRYGIDDEDLLATLREVPRHRFVPENIIHQAYADKALPIREEQTVSQPLIVALMTQAMRLCGSERILEIGTGSGYQAAILSRLCAAVYTVERHPALSQQACSIFEELGYRNIRTKVADGTLGWGGYAPYDGIVVTAGSPKIPDPLVEQLKVGGRMVIPVGDEFAQELTVAEKTDSGVVTQKIGGCRFVKLIGQEAWPE